MKASKLSQLVVIMCSVILLTGCDSTSFDDVTASVRKDATKEFKKSVKKKVKVEINNALESTNLSEFTGKNVSVLPKN